MITNTRICLLAVIAAACGSSHATTLIDMDFEGISGTTVSNAGSAGSGTLIGTGGRPLPTEVTSFNSDTALNFTNTQTGPAHKQAVQVNSGALDNATAFTIATWYRSTEDGTFPTQNTIFSTKGGDAASTDAGIFFGLNFGGGPPNGPQPMLNIGDGTNGRNTFFGPGTFGAYDGEWHFIAVTFNLSDTTEVRYFLGDETTSVTQWNAQADWETFNIASTGDAADIMYIGDGAGGFSSQGAFNGDLDNVFVANTALNLSEIESLRAAAVPEPSSYTLLAGFLALSWVMARRRD